MILAIDVCYRSKVAVAGGILFDNWNDETVLKELIVSCPIPDNYEPGRFYRRELPCIMALLEQLSERPDCIIIDGFVYLGRAKMPGLGKYLYDQLEQKVAVIGVAKTPFKDTPVACELLRGRSLKPLFVTSAGITEEKAKHLVQNMHGRSRIPTLLKYVDRLCRKTDPECLKFSLLQMFA